MIHIDIVGGGSLGLLLAGRLAEAGCPVTLWTRTREQSERINESGIRLRDAERPEGREIAVRSAPLADNAEAGSGGGSRWIVLAVKQSDIQEELLSSLQRLVGRNPGRTAILCIQNGVGHGDKLSGSLNGVPIYAAITTEGARREDATTVLHSGRGEMRFGAIVSGGWRNDDERDSAQKIFVSSMRGAGFAVFLSNDIHNRIYQKLLMNAVINPLTAVFDVVNGELPRHPRRLRLMRMLFEETFRVLETAGMRSSGDEWKRLLDLCRQTGGNVSSMLGDVRAGRTTELAYINGAIIGLAEQFGLDASMNRAVAAIVEAYGTERTEGSDGRGQTMGQL